MCLEVFEFESVGMCLGCLSLRGVGMCLEVFEFESVGMCWKCLSLRGVGMCDVFGSV